MADSNKKAYGSRSLEEQSAIDAEIEEQYEEFYAETYSDYLDNVDELFQNDAGTNTADTFQTETEPSREGDAEPSAETQPDPEEEKDENSEKNDQEEKRNSKSNLTYRVSRNGEQEIEEDPNILSEEEKSRIKKAVAWMKKNLSPGNIFLGLVDLLTKAAGIAIQNIVLGERVQRQLEDFVKKESEKEQNQKNKEENSKDDKNKTQEHENGKNGPGKTTEQGGKDGPGETTEPGEKDDSGKKTEPGEKDDPGKTAEPDKRDGPGKTTEQEEQKVRVVITNQENVVNYLKEAVWGNKKGSVPDFEDGRVYFYKQLTQDKPELKLDPDFKPSAFCCWVSQGELMTQPEKTASAMYHSGYITDPDRDMMKIKNAISAMRPAALVSEMMLAKEGVKQGSLARVSFETEKFGTVNMEMYSKEKGKFNFMVNGEELYKNLPCSFLKKENFQRCMREGMEVYLAGTLNRNSQREINLDDLSIKRDGENITLKFGNRATRSVPIKGDNLNERLEKTFLSKFKSKDPNIAVCHINGKEITAKSAANAIEALYRRDVNDLSLHSLKTDTKVSRPEPLASVPEDKSAFTIASQTGIRFSDARKISKIADIDDPELNNGQTAYIASSQKTNEPVAVVIADEGMIYTYPVSQDVIKVQDASNLSEKEREEILSRQECILQDSEGKASKAICRGDDIEVHGDIFHEEIRTTEKANIPVPDMLTAQPSSVQSYFEQVADAERSWERSGINIEDRPHDIVEPVKLPDDNREFSDPFNLFEVDQSNSYRGDDDLTERLDEDNIAYRKSTDEWIEINTIRPELIEEEIEFEYER